MIKCQQLHETTIRDVMDVISKGAEIKSKLQSNNKSYGSIARRTSDLVLVFPVLVSSSLSIENAVVISKAIERKCVSLLQILFSAINVSELKDTKDLYDHIKKFHTNLKGGALSVDDFITAMNNMVDEGSIEVADPEVYDRIMEQLREINIPAITSFSESSINDYRINKSIYGNIEVELEAGGSNNNSSAVDANVNQVVSKEYNKSNELVPTLMTVNYVQINDQGRPINNTGIIGVKAKLYPVDSMEIINRVSKKYKDGNSLMNFIRATSGEISFIKDLVFAFDKMKSDALQVARGSGNARLFKMLERRAFKNKLNGLLRKNDASPITTLVISQTEVEHLKKFNNMDLEKSVIAVSILDAYNLMGIVIVDEGLEIAKFLYDDGDNIFESLTFDALKKEDKDGSYAKVVNLLTKMGR